MNGPKKVHCSWAKSIHKKTEKPIRNGRSFVYIREWRPKSHLTITQEKLITQFAEIQKELFNDAHKQKPKDEILKGGKSL